MWQGKKKKDCLIEEKHCPHPLHATNLFLTYLKYERIIP